MSTVNVKTTLKMLHPRAPQKFNTFNTFNTFDTAAYSRRSESSVYGKTVFPSSPSSIPLWNTAPDPLSGATVRTRCSGRTAAGSSFGFVAGNGPCDNPP
jgi:hypothetical protein